MAYFGILGLHFVSLAWVKLGTLNLVHLLTMANSSQAMTCCPQMGCGQGREPDSFKFWQKSGNISKMPQDSDIVTGY